jgi:hypothetical protein
MKSAALCFVLFFLFSAVAVTGDTTHPLPGTGLDTDRPSGLTDSSSEHLVQPVSSGPNQTEPGASTAKPDRSDTAPRHEPSGLPESKFQEPSGTDPADEPAAGTPAAVTETGNEAGMTGVDYSVPGVPIPEDPESSGLSAAEPAATGSAAAGPVRTDSENSGTAAADPLSAVPAASASLSEPAGNEVPVPSAETGYPEPAAKPVPPGESVIQYNTVFSYYGHPNSVRMGILGEHPLDELHDLMKRAAAPYDALNGEKGVVLALHLIYGTVWPEGEIGILNRANLLRHIEFARERGMLVFIDHQLGKYNVVEAVTKMLPFLEYENVHLAIDPEWHTVRPGKELGHITAEDLNAAQELMERYMEEHGIPGKKMLIVHQFNPVMIRNRELVRADFPRIDLIHNADGFGNKGQKLSSYRHLAEAKHMPNKGFKLFYPTKLRDWGWDKPLMTPEEVMGLSPQPVLVMYQ